MSVRDPSIWDDCCLPKSIIRELNGMQGISSGNLLRNTGPSGVPFHRVRHTSPGAQQVWGKQPGGYEVPGTWSEAASM